MNLVDKRVVIELQVDVLVYDLEQTISKIESLLSSDITSLKNKSSEHSNEVLFFLIHNAFAALCELKTNLKIRNFISATLITRHLVELYSDFKLISSDLGKLNQYANAFYYFGIKRDIELNKTSSIAARDAAGADWKRFRMDTKNNLHWSGLDRTQVIKRAWDEDDSVYKVLSAQSHSSLLTTDLVFWNYSDRTIGFAEANVKGSVGMVQEIFDIAKKNNFCGVKK